MRLLDAAIGAIAPWTGVGARLLREQLGKHAVIVPLSEGCIEEFVRDAHEAVAATRKSGEPYLDCLRRELDARALFLKRWTTTDDRFEGDEWANLVALARKFALPRPWKIPEPTATEYRPPKVEIPQHLVSASRAPSLPNESADTAGEPPGAAILADVQRAQQPDAPAAGPEAQSDDTVPDFLRNASGKS